jgi:hypothetical protein
MNDAVASVPSLQDVEAAVSAAIEPLRQQLKAVEGRERMILADLEQTRAAKARLVSTLRKIDPDMPRPGKKKQPASTDYGVAERRRAATVEARKAIDKLAAKGAGITKNATYEQLKADGKSYGLGTVSSVVDDLHQSGHLTLDRLGTGGHKIYKRTEDLSNGSPRQAV